MPKPITAQLAARGSASASMLAAASIKQAKTALELSAGLSIERLRLLCPESDAYDIRRLGKRMAELRVQLRDPIEALKMAAERGVLDPGAGLGEGLAKATLRRACASLALEIEAAAEDMPGKIAAWALDLEALAAPAELGTPAAKAPAPGP